METNRRIYIAVPRPLMGDRMGPGRVRSFGMGPGHGEGYLVILTDNLPIRWRCAPT